MFNIGKFKFGFMDSCYKFDHSTTNDNFDQIIDDELNSVPLNDDISEIEINSNDEDENNNIIVIDESSDDAEFDNYIDNYSDIDGFYLFIYYFDR